MNAIRCLAALVVVLLHGSASVMAHDLDLARVDCYPLENGNCLIQVRISPPVIGLPETPRTSAGLKLIRSVPLEDSGDAFEYEFALAETRSGNQSLSLTFPWNLSRMIVVIHQPDGSTSEQFAERTEQGFPVPWQSLGRNAPSNTTSVYLALGIEHILFGMDHLLFVLGLLFLVDSTKRLIATISSFTVAHCISLALVTFDVVRVPQNTVELTIALSLVFLGIEIIRQLQGDPGLTSRFPWIVAFGFGLVHGMGFASALVDLGLPSGKIPQALLLFNVGIEIGQLMFVGTFILMRWAFNRLEVYWPRWSHFLPPYSIGILATVWFVDRLSKVFPS